MAGNRGGQLVVVPDLALVVVVQSGFDVDGQTNHLTRGQDLLPMVDDVVVSRLR